MQALAAQASGEELLPGAYDHPVLLRLDGEDEERRRGGEAEAAPLADGVAVIGLAGPQLAPRRVDQPRAAAERRAGRPIATEKPLRARRGLLLDELAHAAGDEADLHALPLLRHHQAGLAGELTHLRLGHAAEREEGGGELLAGQLEEVVALVLLGVERGVQLGTVRTLEDAGVVECGS